MMMCGKMFLLSLFIIVLFLTQGVSSIQHDMAVDIEEIIVPKSSEEGDDVALTCKFRLQGRSHKLYTVNWWRGKDQFYTYKEHQFEPKSSFPFNGINVDKARSSNETVVLKDVSEETSGTFKCEVMGEGPAFRTAVDSKNMTVVVLPSSVDIQSLDHPDRTLYRVGDKIHLNCTAKGAKPAAVLTWTINGREVRDLEVQRFPNFENYRGRVTSAIGLQWRAPDYFEGNQANIRCRADVDGHLKDKELKLHLDPASSAAYNHQYASSGNLPTTRIPAWTLLILSSILITRIYL